MPGFLDENNTHLKDVYFISKDLDVDFMPRGVDFQNHVSYAEKLTKAYGLTIQFDRNKTNLKSLKNLHSNLFSLGTILDIASINYDPCHMIQLSRSDQSFKKMQEKSSLNYYNKKTTTKKPDIEPTIVNITIICIKKNDLNEYLIYNTLYFWFEHTLVNKKKVVIVFFCV
jgi:hypothetical protein